MMPNTQSRDLSYMYNIRDLRRPIKDIQATPETVLGLIQRNPDFSSFYHIVKIARMEDVLNDAQFNSTIFVPSDIYLEKSFPKSVIMNLDKSTAVNIVKYSILPVKIDARTLKSSPTSYFMTRYDPLKILVNNIKQKTVLNNSLSVIFYDAMLSNGIIHVLDGLLVQPSII